MKKTNLQSIIVPVVIVVLVLAGFLVWRVNKGKTANLNTPSANSNLCDAGSLEGSSLWQKAGKALAGAIKISNRGGKTCSVPSYPDVKVESNLRSLDIKEVRPLDSSLSRTELKPDESLFLRFIWSNWCNDKISDSANLMITLPDNKGSVRIPVYTANGSASSDTPGCDADDASSTLRLF